MTCLSLTLAVKSAGAICVGGVVTRWCHGWFSRRWLGWTRQVTRQRLSRSIRPLSIRPHPAAAAGLTDHYTCARLVHLFIRLFDFFFFFYSLRSPFSTYNNAAGENLVYTAVTVHILFRIIYAAEDPPPYSE